MGIVGRGLNNRIMDPGPWFRDGVSRGPLSVGVVNPGLLLSTNVAPENGAQGATLFTATPTNASNPLAVSILAIDIAGALQVNADGRTIEQGPTALDLDTHTSPFSVTFRYTDDNGTYDIVRSITIQQLAPTIANPLADITNTVGNGPFLVDYSAAYAGSGHTVALFDIPTDANITIDTVLEQITIADEQVLGTVTLAISNGAGTIYDDFEVDISLANTAPQVILTAFGLTVPEGTAGNAPAQFAAGGWSVADDGTNGDITITITTLPSDNGSALTDLEYRIDGGAAVSLGAATTGNYGVSGLTDGTSVTVEVRARNANGPGPWSATKSVTPTGVPAAFTAGDWSIADLGSGGDARITIATLPSDAGSAITDLEVKIGAAAYASLGGTTTGTYDLTDAFTDGVATNVLIRAVNANGDAADSDTKSVTTSAGGAISIVGQDGFGTKSTTATIDLTPFSLQQDDIVLIGGGRAFSGAQAISMVTAGYTQIDSTIQTGGTNRTNFGAFIKRMGATPDTSVEISVGANLSNGGAGRVIVLRGVDTTTALDVAAVVASDIGGNLANPGPITPVTANALIIALLAGANDSTVTAATGPANMTTFEHSSGGGTTRRLQVGLATQLWSGSGALDPDAWTGTDNDANDSWGAFTIAFRPA